MTAFFGNTRRESGLLLLALLAIARYRGLLSHRPRALVVNALAQISSYICAFQKGKHFLACSLDASPEAVRVVIRDALRWSHAGRGVRAFTPAAV